MAVFDVRLVLPNVLYHGTTFAALNGIAAKPINRDFWHENKDFGAGFYTTIDLFQATDWARNRIKDILLHYKQIRKKRRLLPLRIARAQMPMVAAFSCNPDAYVGENIHVFDFRGESKAWAQFILSHRHHSKKGICSCPKHPQIACGCMADNDTGAIIDIFKELGKSITSEADLRWFWERIIQSKKGDRLKGLELGDQIAFFDEELNPMMKFKGYYLFNPNKFQIDLKRENYREEWDFYDPAGNPAKDD